MRILFLTLVVLAGYAVAPAGLTSADGGASAEYVGGTLALQLNTDGKIQTTDDEYFQFRCKRSDIRVQYASINLLEYGQKVDRRYAMAVLISPMFLLSKKRQHFLTVGYTDEQGKQQALVFKVEKGKVRSVLVALEARTGRRVQFQDDEARKAGKG